VKQYPTLSRRILSQFLIRHVTRVFGLPLSSPRHPGQGFLSLVHAIQRRRFIPQGAIIVVRMTFVSVDSIAVMFLSCKGLVVIWSWETAYNLVVAETLAKRIPSVN
jgi:hypothetical protein